jgi:hypothetical protein
MQIPVFDMYYWLEEKITVNMQTVGTIHEAGVTVNFHDLGYVSRLDFMKQFLVWLAFAVVSPAADPSSPEHLVTLNAYKTNPVFKAEDDDVNAALVALGKIEADKYASLYESYMFKWVPVSL